MKVGRYLLLAVLVAVGTVIGVRQWRRHAHQTGARATVRPAYDEEALNTHAPDSVRIKVEVFNATKIRGLGRRATIYLRDRGFDVVLTGTTHLQLAQTLVLDRSHHPAWAALVAKAMHGRMQSRPDTSGYLDVTVFVGGDWTPPPLPFYP